MNSPERCQHLGCGKPRDDNKHATNGRCFAQPAVCKRVHKHHDFVAAKPEEKA